MAAPDAAPTGAFDPRAPLEPSRALAPFRVRLNATLVRARFWPKIRAVAAHIPFAEDALALFHAAVDRETPAASKAVMLAALAYFVLPADAIPDWLPGLGFTDDAAVIAAALGVAGRSIKPRHREAARARLDRIAGAERAPGAPDGGPAG